MKQIIGLVLCMILAGCNLFEQVTPPQPTAAQTQAMVPTTPATEVTAASAQQGLSEEVLCNSEFLAPQLGDPVQLVDCQFTGLINNKEVKVSLVPGVQFGDLNSDGTGEAVVLIIEQTGGNKILTSLVVIYSQGNAFKQSNGLLIDDHAVINSIYINKGIVQVEALLHNPNDVIENPTLAANLEYRLMNDRLYVSRMTTQLEGGLERSITIDKPLEDEIVEGTINLVGSMPIAPFENSLSLRIISEDGLIISQTGFMVTAADMGTPGTFDNLVNVGGLVPGEKILVELSEQSMANGEPLAIATVELLVE